MEVNTGLPNRNRTCDPQLRRLMLYPTELWAEMVCGGLNRSAVPSNRGLTAGRRRCCIMPFLSWGFNAAGCAKRWYLPAVKVHRHLNDWTLALRPRSYTVSRPRKHESIPDRSNKTWSCIDVKRFPYCQTKIKIGALIVPFSPCVSKKFLTRGLHKRAENLFYCVHYLS